MDSFESFNLSKQLHYAIDDLKFEKPTPIQSAAFSVVLSGRDVVGIAQTGTGKTLAYMLPILHELKFSKQVTPRILILVPTRELVIQVVEKIESFAKYINLRVLGVYGEANINLQHQAIAQGTDIIVGTPGRLYELVVTRALKLKAIKKLVIDEVDVMLDLGFRFQLANIFELLPERRQNIMFSATMTDDVAMLIEDYFIEPAKVSVAVSGTPLDNIAQSCFFVPNFYTKVNLLSHLLQNKEVYSKVLIFVATKKRADKLFEAIEDDFGAETCVIHSNKTQNYRIRSIERFDEGIDRILISTDVMARGLDLDRITHVINFDTPNFPENYMHRIGRTGRATQEGAAILFSTEKEKAAKLRIESLMSYTIPKNDLPEEVEISEKLLPEEMPNDDSMEGFTVEGETPKPHVHEKKEKNKKTNQGGSYRREVAKKYKKPKTRGDKNFNRRKKNRK
ncbi:DEAD/DEAH box helicase [Sungkyunkwania multivorans]|uniref:DEAD/DEAH box helicase n=1 Tax=Sungkyunkwania multivorans TaxID=1173618 RepID=A0ABW3CW56_9FLAO